MSKKMLKRSLALGALMAFVITGQAWADTFNSTFNPQEHVDQEYTDLTIEVGSSGRGIHGNGFVTVDNTLKINSEGNAIAAVDDDLTVSANEIYLTTNHVSQPNNPTNGIVITENQETLTGKKVTVNNFTKLVINADGHGINTCQGDGNTISLIGKENSVVSITAGENGVYTYKFDSPYRPERNKVEIKAGTVTINATAYSEIGAEYKGYAVIAANKNSTIEIEATGKVDLDGANGAIKAMNGSTINVSGNSVDANGVIVTGFNSKVEMNSDTTTNIQGAVTVQHGSFVLNSNAVTINANDAYAFDTHFSEGNSTISAETINITSTGNEAGDAHKSHAVYAYSDSVSNIKDFKTLNISTYNKSTDAAEGGSAIIAHNGSDITVTGLSDAVANIYAEGRAAVVAMGGNPASGNSAQYENSTVNMKVDTLNLSGKPIDDVKARKNSVLAVHNDSSEHGGAQVEITAKELNVVNLSTAANTNAIGVFGSSATDAVMTIKADTANVTGSIKVDKGTLDISNIKDLVLVGLTPESDAAIKVNDGVLKVNTAGTLAIDKAEADKTYNVVTGVGEGTKLWSDENLAYDRTTMIATSNHDTTNKLYTVKYESFNNVSEVTPEIQEQFVVAVGGEELAVPGLVAASTGQGSKMEDTAPGAKEFLAKVSSDAEMSKETKAAVINSAAKLAEAGGNAGTAVSVANNVSGITTGRMSFGGRGHGGHKGGHGVGLFEEGSGAAVWAQYMHGKDEATDMPMDGGATSYESEYDGIVVGVDFKKVGKFQSGIAFNYGEGDSNGFGSGIKTSSEYDFWGVGYYGNIRNEDTNFIFDVNYAKSDSDVTQKNITGDIEASPETTTWSAGVKVEKLYQNNNVQIVPYTGLRYMSIDTDEYQSNVAGKALFNYAPERQDIWLLPLGVTIKQEVVNDNGWVVTPKVDLSYIWAFGDTDSNMSVSIPGIAASNDTLGFTVMDDGSFLGLVGVEAKLDDWTFGVSYSYQKGDYAESKKWFVDAKYSF